MGGKERKCAGEKYEMKLCAKWMTIVVENVALIILSVSGEFFFTRHSIFKTE